MTVEKDVQQFIKAAEAHYSSENVSLCNKKEALMKEIAFAYFMSDDEPKFYGLLFDCNSNISKFMAASYCERMRYDLQTALTLLELSKSENWVFSNNPKKQSGALYGVDNTIRFAKKTIVEQQNFGDDRLFRQIVMYRFLLAAYFEAWMDFKHAKEQETWQSLTEFVKQIIADGKQDKFFCEMLNNSQHFQKLFTAMIGGELNCCISQCSKTLEMLIAENVLNPRLQKLAQEQLQRIRKI